MVPSSIGLSSKCLFPYHAPILPSLLFSHFHFSLSSSSSSSLSHSNINFTQLTVSSEGLPNELVEDSKFVPLNSEDPSYGPPVSHGLITVGL
ncbi:hypothetical protein Lalb_Chr21g0313491 [Lupinus albus]|uniref:Uncharacterized protein n=1 Tax=Lupinus albus TaxID=3870 RepID=A0A6A4NR64_LUPAL|nr:hypothetical protein Lalb_Chr21g0313491 [Lupinus albus]